MIQNYFKIAWRNLLRYKGHAFINIGGLSLGFACSVLIYLFVQHNLQYDNFHTNSDRIYRVVTEEHRDDIDFEASVPPGFAQAFRTEYDYAEKVAKHALWDNELISFP
ncbi:MAG: ABC transporter permease, partial [Bacteroidota bacterium]